MTETSPADTPSDWLPSFLSAIDRCRHVLFAFLLLTLAIGFTGRWRIDPDSALYLSLARNLARGRGYTYHGLPHHLVYPGFPYLLSWMFRLVPGHAIAACGLLMLACAAACLGLIYRLLSLTVGRPVAVLITVLCGGGHEFLGYCYTIMPEIPFLLGVTAVLAGIEAIFRRHATPRGYDWALLIVGSFAVINLKPMMLPLLAAVLVTLPWRSPDPVVTRRRRVAAGIIVSLLLLFLIYDPRHPFTAAGSASYEQLALREAVRFPNQWRHLLGQNLADLFGQSAVRAVFGVPLGFTSLNMVFGLIVVAAGISLFRFRPLWGLWVAAVVMKVCVLYSYDRYLIPILPLLIFGWWRCIYHLDRRFPSRWTGAICIILLLATWGANAIKGGITLSRRDLHQLESYDGNTCQLALVRTSWELASETSAEDIVLAPTGTSRILGFLGDRNVYEPITGRIPRPTHRIFRVEPEGPDKLEFDAWIARLGVGQESHTRELARSTR